MTQNIKNRDINRGGIVRLAVGTSAADTAQTVSTTVGRHVRILFITAKYSAAPTQTGVTVTLNSGAGAGYDTLLTTGTANTQNTVYFPSEPLVLADDDTLDVTAPAAGGVITSSVAIYGLLL